MDIFELIHIELLVNNAHSEVNAIRRRQIDSDFVHIEPKQEPLDLNAFQLCDRAIGELASYGLLVVDQVLELHVARLPQNDDESAIVGQRVVRNRRG